MMLVSGVDPADEDDSRRRQRNSMKRLHPSVTLEQSHFASPEMKKDITLKANFYIKERHYVQKHAYSKH